MEVLRDGKFSLPIKDKELMRGIRRDKNQSRNKNTFASMTGMIGKEGSLVSLPALTIIDTSIINDSFPYPQLFVLSNVIIICSSTKVYEFIADSLVEMIEVSAGKTWKVIDFFDYVYLSNEKVAVIRDASSRIYSITTTLPTFSACCNYNGQVLIGAPDVEPTPIDTVTLCNPVDPIDPNEFRIVMGGLPAGTIWRFDNSSTTEPVIETLYTVSRPKGAWQSAIQLTDGTLLFAIQYEILGEGYYFASVVRSTDNGDTWTHIQVTQANVNGITYPWAFKKMVELSDGTVVGILSLSNDYTYIEIWSSTDSGETWSETAIIEQDLNQATMCKGNGDVLIVGTYADSYGVDKIYRSIDKGVTWTDINIGSGNDKINNIISLYYVTGDIIIGSAYTTNAEECIIRSIDNGLTWSVIDIGLSEIVTSFLTLEDGTVYALHKTSSIATTTDIWESIDNGATWSFKETWTAHNEDVPYLYRNPFEYNELLYGFYHPYIKID